jgi:hypothetical protein
LKGILFKLSTGSEGLSSKESEAAVAISLEEHSTAREDEGSISSPQNTVRWCVGYIVRDSMIMFCQPYVLEKQTEHGIASDHRSLFSGSNPSNLKISCRTALSNTD